MVNHRLKQVSIDDYYHIKINKRTAILSDLNWLYELKIASMKDYINQVYGWDKTLQKNLFVTHFCPSNITIITVDDIDVGMYELTLDNHGYFLKRFEILPNFHNRGIGTFILNQILSLARANNLPVRLQVFKINPAQKLYQKLGFKIVGNSTEHYEMLAKTGD